MSKKIIATFNKKTVTMDELAEALGITESSLRYRLHHMPLAKALTTPRGAKGSHNRRTISISEQEQIVRLYIGGETEDVIAAKIGRSRSTLSKYLVSWGLKQPGSRPTRLGNGNGKAIKVARKGTKITLTLDCAA